MADATSWAPEVFVEGKWSRNALRFATKQEAESNAANLIMEALEKGDLAEVWLHLKAAADAVRGRVVEIEEGE